MQAIRLGGLLLLAALASPSAGKVFISLPPSGDSGQAFRVEKVMAGLVFPWSLAFLPDGRLLVTERSGRLRVLDISGPLPVPLEQANLIPGLPADLAPLGEGGLLGIVLHPNFAQNRWLYLYYTYLEGDARFNRVARFTFANDELSDQFNIISEIPGARIHDGGRIKFGPDGLLYITTGDAEMPDAAQDLTSLAGKVLRVTDAGAIPAGNPFAGSPIFSYGHRNPQGIAFDTLSGLIFATEHGPVGGDEVNIILPGRNYGWPLVTHDQVVPGFEPPLLEYTPAIAPSGCTFYNGAALLGWRHNFFFTNLRGRNIRRVVLDTFDRRRVRSDGPLFKDDEFGRIRDVIQGPDGFLYFCTGGAADAHFPELDRIHRIVPDSAPPPGGGGDGDGGGGGSGGGGLTPKL